MSRVFGNCRALMEAAKAKAKTSAPIPKPKPKPKPNPTAAAATATVAAASSATKSKATSGIMKPVPVSPAMRKFLGGTPEISRPEAVKKIWEHIKLNHLQNPANKKEIHCDEKLKSIFDGKEKVGMLEIARLLAPHFIKSTTN